MNSVPKGVETVKFSKMGEGVVFLDDDAELDAVIEEAEMEAAAEPEDNKAKAPLVRTRPMSTSLFFCLSCKSQNAHKRSLSRHLKRCLLSKSSRANVVAHAQAVLLCL